MENITGNQNIIIQGVTDSTITIEINGEQQKILNELAELKALLQKFQAQTFQTADKIYNIGSITNANFDFVVKQADYPAGLPQELRESLVSSEQELWVKSLRQEFTKRNIPVGNNVFHHYGWLIEVFLDKMCSPIGKELSLRALSFMTEAYQASLRYLCVIQTAQLLQKDPPIKSPLLTEYISLNPDDELRFDYLYLLIIHTELLVEGKLFVPEIQDFVTEVSDTESDLYGVALFLDKVRRQLIKNELQETETLPQLLIEYRTALIYWLRKMAFLAKYRLVSMKEINISYRLGTTKNFVHFYGELHGTYNEHISDFQKQSDYITFSVKDTFTYNHSVLLFNGLHIDRCLAEMYEKENYISLSPLVIDQSVFQEKEKQTPEVFYFLGNLGRQYQFSHYRNEMLFSDKKARDSNKKLQVKKENEDQPKLNELFEHLEQIFQPFKKRKS